jgi:hypothetical protein
MKIVIPMKSRRFGVSKTAKREQDWKFKLQSIGTKAEQEKFMRKIGRTSK